MQQTHLFTSTRSTQYKWVIRLEKGSSPLMIKKLGIANNYIILSILVLGYALFNKQLFSI